MAKYTMETKNRALEMMAQVGVSKTCEAMKITKATLYKWRNEAKLENKQAAQPKQQTSKLKNEELTDGADAMKNARDLLAEDDNLVEKVWQLENENVKLRERNAKLKAALLAFIE